MTSEKYWQERFEAMADYYYKQGDKTLPELQKLFKNTNDEMKKEMLLFYDKYGENIKAPSFVTLPDGTQVIDGTKVARVVPLKEALKYDRLVGLSTKLNTILKDLASGEKKYMTKTLSTIAEDAYYNSWYEMFYGYKIGFKVDLITPEQIKEIISHPVNGQNFITRVGINNQLLANQINQIITSGITQGLSITDMTKRLSDGVGMGYKVAERLIRTETTNTYSQSTLQMYNKSGIVKEYRYLATLDNRTSAICQDLDGKVFKIDNAITGLNYPPMHPNCRSTTVSIFDDEVFERRARDANGKTYTVPSNMTYHEWKKQYGSL